MFSALPIAVDEAVPAAGAVDTHAVLDLPSCRAGAARRAARGGPCAAGSRPVGAADRDLGLLEYGPDDPGRDEVETFVREVYRRHHEAHVRHFAPRLVALRDGSGDGSRVIAAAGYRFATEPLFLERYLDRPIDEVLGQRLGAAPRRAHIVEVGHLAGTESGAGRRLILQLGPHLAERQAQWVVGTLTQELRQLFVRMGVTPMALAIADPARLGDEALDWGRYYGHAPTVLAGHLPLALRRLERLLRR